MTETMRTKLSPQVRNAPTVLIVGAGPTELTLACELARSGVSFRLIEAAPGPQPGPELGRASHQPRPHRRAGAAVDLPQQGLVAGDVDEPGLPRIGALPRIRPSS